MLGAMTGHVRQAVPSRPIGEQTLVREVKNNLKLRKESVWLVLLNIYVNINTIKPKGVV